MSSPTGPMDFISGAFFSVNWNGENFGVFTKASGGSIKLKAIKNTYVDAKGMPRNGLLHGAKEYQDLTLERPLVAADRTGLMKWHKAAQDGNMQEARKDINIVMRAPDGAPFLEMRLYEAYIIDLQLSNIDSGTTSFVSEKVIISFTSMEYAQT
jgi:phage tail-like protein